MTIKTAICVWLFIMGTALAAYAGGNRASDLAAPKLMVPDETADASKDVEFRWSGEGVTVDYFDFRVYQGIKMNDEETIIKEKLPPGHSTYVAKAGTLKPGQTYSWGVRSINGTRKSRRNFSIFKT
jgi:hypothetical protein